MEAREFWAISSVRFENMPYGQKLESSHQGCSDEWPQHMFSQQMRLKLKNIQLCLKTPIKQTSNFTFIEFQKKYFVQTISYSEF